MEIKRIIIDLYFDEIEANLRDFSRVISALHKNYPLVVGVVPGVVKLSKPDGGSIDITSTYITLRELFKKPEEKAPSFVKSIVEDICKNLSIKKFSSCAFQIFGVKKSTSEKPLRPLLKNMSSRIPKEIENTLETEVLGMGIRIVFKRDNRVNIITVEPFFEDLKYNFFSYMVSIKKGVSINKSFEIMDEEYTFFKQKVNNIWYCQK